MRKSTFNYIKDILSDYYKIDDYIKQREQELRHPHQEEDLNGDIKGNKASYDDNINMLITIEQDKRLYNLERNKYVISNALDDHGTDTETIITELYLKRRPVYTMQGLIDNNLIFCSRAKAFRLRNQFFEDLAKEFGLDM